MCPRALSLQCPNACSAKGKCNAGSCVCNPGWGSPDCSVAACPKDCSSHGTCSNGVCRCEKGYSGDDCETVLACTLDGADDTEAIACVNGAAAGTTGDCSCTCDEGYSGDLCGEDEDGCDGVDWDLEQGGVGTELGALVRASARLKASRGADFAVTVSAEPGLRLYEEFALAEGEATVGGRTWRGRVCDLYGSQFSDFAQTAAERRADIVATARRLVDRGLEPSRFAIGTTYAGSALGEPGQMSVEKYLAAYRTLADAGVRVRGAYVWDMTIEGARGYPFAEAFGAALGT